MTVLHLLLISFILACTSTAFAEALNSHSSNNNMKRVVVTGANKGIGKACCQKLLEEHSDVFVWLGSRSSERGEEAVQDIIKSVGGDCQDRIAMVTLDVSSEESVLQAAAKIQQQLKGDGKLYGIINNAGIIRGPDHSVVDTNYFGTKRVVNAFLPLLQRPGGRIVNVASASGPYFVQGLSQRDTLYKALKEPWTIEGGLDGVDELAKKYCDQYGSSYAFSKALVNAYNLLLARSQPDLIVNAVTPGWIKTDMTVGQGATNPPSQGAVPPVWALMDPELESTTTGLYYGSDCKRSPIHEYRSPGDPVYNGPTGIEATSSK
ncbi:short-chain dehydrogenase/reductase SDR [Nitzschia inconspicua]|uniref:Short-chain dehydrogenase/reductase SDR n=1 Tax=Nitzschia inconspicua TaxID=303405 RepID=A0A9K3M6Y2_9STRA|nr:short-chain dehydrogenase/reductase SDR [Nitzschia inconspicua]